MNSGDCFSLWIQEIAITYMNLQQLDIEFRYMSSYLIKKVGTENRTRIDGMWAERARLYAMKPLLKEIERANLFIIYYAY